MLFDMAHPTGRSERRLGRTKCASGFDIRGRAASRGDMEPIGVLTFDRDELEVAEIEERASLDRLGEEEEKEEEEIAMLRGE